MKQLFKQIIKKNPLYDSISNWLKERRQDKKIREWEVDGKPVPPPHIVKQRTLAVYRKSFRLNVLVESGTYYGDMVEAMKKKFDSIYSIELSKELYEKATERFNGIDHIELIHGDSGIELGNVMKRITQPTLFWLDGHYSAGVTARGDKDTPIYEELNHILNSQDRRHVVIIDDARCFGTDPAYPSIEELTYFIRSKRPDINIDIQDDSIRITPKK